MLLIALHCMTMSDLTSLFQWQKKFIFVKLSSPCNIIPCRPLSLGKVNEFGIFEPIFEPEPDRDTGISTGNFSVQFPCGQYRI